jgi:FdhD protein
MINPSDPQPTPDPVTPAPPAVPIHQFHSGRGWSQHLDPVASEEPLEIRVDTRPVTVTLRTPGHDAELAAGFLLTEAVIRSGADIARFLPHPRNPHGAVLDVQLRPDLTVDFARLTRHVFAVSSCGLCGKAAIDAIRQSHPPIDDPSTLDPDWLLSLPQAMRAAQTAFDSTGGIHAAALFPVGGPLRVLREDIGRHNAVDKVIGHMALSGHLPLKAHVLLVSGRVSFEVMQKALAAGIPIVAAISAPSSLAIQFAIESHQTLVGFLREGRFNVYAGPHRLGIDPPPTDL